VIPNGVDAGAFTPGTPGQDGLLFVGRLIERKGVDRLIEAMRPLAETYPGLRLAIAGDGPERARLEAMVREYGLAERVRFHGFLERAPLAEAYRRAGVFVLPALGDAMPNVVLEAMAAGLAIVTTRTGAKELLDDNGLIVERAEPEALRAGIATYLGDRALLARHQKNSRRRAESMSWAAVANYYTTRYVELAAAPRGVATALRPRSASS
jgi:glycosyltransferase involved in cell wall biosynthesis